MQRTRSISRTALSLRRARRPRSGIATVWTIGLLLAGLSLLAVVSDLGMIWLARLELENALEAAALAATKQWADDGGGDGGATLAARTAAQSLAAANTVHGAPVVLDLNFNPASVNDNDQCDGDIVMGAVTPAASPFTFDGGTTAVCGASGLGVRIRKSQSIPSLFGSLFGTVLGPYQVTSTVTAVRFDCAAGPSALVRIETYLCP